MVFSHVICQERTSIIAKAPWYTKKGHGGGAMEKGQKLLPEQRRFIITRSVVVVVVVVVVVAMTAFVGP
jgi:hypothetical protein